MITPLHGQSLILGKRVNSPGADYQATSPLTDSLLEPKFRAGTAETVDAALRAAEEAFTIYRRTPSEKRARLLEAIASEIESLGDDLLERAYLETGLTKERLASERGRTVNQLRLFAEVVREGSWQEVRIETPLPEREPLPKPDLRRWLRPLGLVIVFGASNFPFAYSVAGGDTASALAAGCPVVVKAHPAHPGVSEMVGEAIIRALEKCDLPPGIFGLVHGPSAEIGLALVRHPLASAVGFTGSRTGGRALFDAAAARPTPIPVFAEMSSLNPLFLLPGALRERAAEIAEDLSTSITSGLGQFCTKPGLIFGVEGPSLHGFRQLLGRSICQVPPGTMLHAGIRNSYRQGTEAASSLPGVQTLAVSSREAMEAKNEAASYLLSTSVSVFLKEPGLQEEIFGPCSFLIAADCMDEMVKAAKHLEGQLTATVHGTPEDLDAAGELLAILERKAGRLIFNGFPTGVEVCPSMQHGGPYPASTDGRFTSVGTASILRWARPVCYQNLPVAMLPPELQASNPLDLMRLVNGTLTRDPIAE